MTNGSANERQRLPFKVDPFRFAHDAVELESSLPLSQMTRLSAMLYQPDGEIEVNLAFSVDVLGVSMLQGRIQASLELICQRCLEPVHFEVDSSLALGFARSAAGMEQISSSLEPVRAEAGQVNLLDLLEDEIMLALPQIPRHKENECQASAIMDEPAELEAQPEERKNPFSILAGLKTNKEN
ncbi:hypothetical protein MNBD_GAMMA25-400 [hydrothermal vent metagenome]|uniref:Large ribosomal RNA subunit accumulation protein YceD n=1 Tax=hydrothermal vent metagenome TaxID=652676 RepID=A0A3B1BMP6_9ZZZZ